MTGSSRLLTFDALRGIAAILVLMFHFDKSLVPGGYLAVDVFFLLSGFVISRMYDDRLRAGMPLRQFAASRIIRLYPLYAVGLAIGILLSIEQWLRHRPDAYDGATLSIAAGFELFLLPSPATRELFPMNMPAWSLFFELVVNFLYAAFLIRIRERAMIAIAALSGAALVWFASSSPSLDIGYGWATFSGGLARAAFTFTIGVIIARRQRATARGSALAMLPPIALVGLLVVPVPTTLRIVYDLLVAMTAAPLLVWLAAIYNPRPELESMSRAAGDLSYAVYAIHVPLLWIVASVIRHFDVPRAIVLPIFIALLLAGCRALDRHYDAPIRARLNGMLLAATLRAKSTATE